MPVGGNRHLWIADTVSGTARQITAGHTNETAPAVAPGGPRIAYASEEVDFDLTLIAPDGRTRRTMLATARNEFDPAWSPAGDQFAFVTDRSGSLEIWARSRDGVWERPIVTAEDFGRLADRNARLAGVFSRRANAGVSTGRGGHVGCVAVAGQRRRTHARDHHHRHVNRPWRDAPTWSPDGEWIAYVVNEPARWCWSRRAWAPPSVWRSCRPRWLSRGRCGRLTASGSPRKPTMAWCASRPTAASPKLICRTCRSSPSLGGRIAGTWWR